MAWLTHALLLSIFWSLYCAAFSDDLFYRVGSLLTLVFVICLALGWNAPSSPLSPVARVLTEVFGVILFFFTPIPTIVLSIFSPHISEDSFPISERLLVFDEIPKGRTKSGSSNYVEYALLPCDARS